MAFIAGSANTANEVLTALQNACTANGWTLANGVLNKGDCYAKPFLNDGTIALVAGAGSITNTPTLRIGSTNYIPGYPNMWVSLAGINTAIPYPVTYSIHVMENPNEVYLFINHSVDSWAYIAFGQSPVENLTGSGVWYAGTGIGTSTIRSVDVANQGVNGHLSCMLFSYVNQSGTTTNGYQSIKSFFHHGISDLASEWSISGINGAGDWNTYSWDRIPTAANATLTLIPLMTREPSAWNSGASLHPIQPSVIRLENRRSIVGNLNHARYARLDNIDPGQIDTIGSEKWRFYPWIKKNITDRNATALNNNLHSGTYGVAVRYDGT